jgi:hypothetical protein
VGWEMGVLEVGFVYWMGVLGERLQEDDTMV